MAQRIVTILMDDLDGTEGEDIETVGFAFEGVSYEIDLNKDNRESFAAALAPYIDSARRQGRRSGGASKRTADKSPAAKPTYSSSDELEAIRAWARENGYTVADRGRVAQKIKDAYYAAN